MRCNMFSISSNLALITFTMCKIQGWQLNYIYHLWYERTFLIWQAQYFLDISFSVYMQPRVEIINNNLFYVYFADVEHLHTTRVCEYIKASFLHSRKIIVNIFIFSLTYIHFEIYYSNIDKLAIKIALKFSF